MFGRAAVRQEENRFSHFSYQSSFRRNLRRSIEKSPLYVNGKGVIIWGGLSHSMRGSLVSDTGSREYIFLESHPGLRPKSAFQDYRFYMLHHIDITLLLGY